METDMLNKLLLTSAMALALATGAQAQNAAPQTAPSVTTPQSTAPQTTLAPTEVTASGMMNAAIYAPKATTVAGQAAATRSTAPMDEPRTTGSVAGTPSGGSARGPITSVSDADWNAMRENHDNIGSVNNIVLDNEGRARQVVLGVGGFLGVGEKAVAVDWNDVRWMRDSKGKLFGIVQRTKQQLDAAPRFVDRT
jgi:PRC-barrel domain